MLSLRLSASLFFIAFFFHEISANELTFELPDNAKECFNEKLKTGSKYVLAFQVKSLKFSKTKTSELLLYSIGRHGW